jgi:hypothetical protein
MTTERKTAVNWLNDPVQRYPDYCNERVLHPEIAVLKLIK